MTFNLWTSANWCLSAWYVQMLVHISASFTSSVPSCFFLLLHSHPSFFHKWFCFWTSGPLWLACRFQIITTIKLYTDYTDSILGAMFYSVGKKKFRIFTAQHSHMSQQRRFSITPPAAQHTHQTKRSTSPRKLSHKSCFAHRQTHSTCRHFRITTAKNKHDKTNAADWLTDYSYITRQIKKFTQRRNIRCKTDRHRHRARTSSPRRT